MVITGESRRGQDHAGAHARPPARIAERRDGPGRQHAARGRRPRAHGGRGFGLPTRVEQGRRCSPGSSSSCSSTHRQGKRALLMVDEAQNLPRGVGRGAAHAVELQRRREAAAAELHAGPAGVPPDLQSPHMEQLRQRVIASCHLGPMDARGDRGLHHAPAADRRAGAAIRRSARTPSPPSTSTPAAFRAGSTSCATACCSWASWTRSTRSPARK